jgi:hypothetical protein
MFNFGGSLEIHHSATWWITPPCRILCQIILKWSHQMIKFILNKQEASNKAKRKTKSRIPGIERFIPGNDAKMLPPYTHLGDVA